MRLMDAENRFILMTQALSHPDPLFVQCLDIQIASLQPVVQKNGMRLSMDWGNRLPKIRRILVWLIQV